MVIVAANSLILKPDLPSKEKHDSSWEITC